MKVYAALQTNPVQSNIPATFFVQTHVPNRGGSSTGAAVMAEALSRGHDVMIHTQLRAAINGGDTDIVILFHDIHSHTADNLGTASGYIQLIKDVAASLGYTVAFAKL